MSKEETEYHVDGILTMRANLVKSLKARTTLVTIDRTLQHATIYSHVENMVKQQRLTDTSRTQNEFCHHPYRELMAEMKLLSDIWNGRELPGNIRPVRKEITQADVTPPPQIEDLE